MAIWKDIQGYEGLYRVSDQGEIISLKAASKPMKQRKHGRKGHLYMQIGLTKDGVQTMHLVHRLVAKAFIPNPDNFPEINHKDKNPLNNQVGNLEWCSHQYNIDYSKSKGVAQIRGEIEIARYKSIKEAGRQTGITRTGINNVLSGMAKTAGGFQWVYCE